MASGYLGLSDKLWSTKTAYCCFYTEMQSIFVYNYFHYLTKTFVHEKVVG